MNPDKPGLREYLSSLGSKAARGTIGWGTRVADWVDDKVDTAKDFYERKAIASGHPLVAGATTFGTGVIGDVVKGTADVLRLGNGTADAIDQFKQGDYAGGASSLAQDGGRVGGVILSVVGGAARGAPKIEAREITAKTGKNSVRTPEARYDLRQTRSQDGHYNKAAGRDVQTPHVHRMEYHTNPAGKVFPKPADVPVAATRADIKAAARGAGVKLVPKPILTKPKEPEKLGESLFGK
jgi:hypothetical protein